MFCTFVVYASSIFPFNSTISNENNTVRLLAAKKHADQDIL